MADQKLDSGRYQPTIVLPAWGQNYKFLLWAYHPKGKFANLGHSQGT